ncbi:MAG: hypothetical protein HY720_04365 [Planctomycetes bacterium]|nr:hypothetical protein [Planctomycetota bacterium]
MKNHALRRGQGMTEYIIIIAVVAIAVLFVVKEFGGTVGGKFTEAKGTIQTNLDASGGSGAGGGAGAGGGGP